MKPSGLNIFLPGSIIPNKNARLQVKLTKIQNRVLASLTKGSYSLEEVWEILQKELVTEDKSFQRYDLLKELFDLEEKGIVEIHFPTKHEGLCKIHEGLRKSRNLCRESPGLWNVLAYEREWDQYNDYFDFLDEGSPNYLIKRFQRRIYMKQIERFLDQALPKGARILDAGGGIGRFGEEFIGREYEVFLVDASEKALKCAATHYEKRKYDRYHLFLGDVEELSEFEDDFFHATFAMELICYCTRPENAVKEISRVTAPGGWLFFSVEGKHGSMLADTKIQADHFRDVMDEGTLLRENDLFVRYFTEEELKKYLVSLGLHVVEVSGSHYVPDGIFHRFLNEKGLGSEETEQVLFEIEKQCAQDPVLQPLARAWLAVCHNNKK